MADLVRVRLDGFEKTVGRTFAEKYDLDVLDEPATRADGSVRTETRIGGRRTKPKTTVSQEAAKKASAKPASEKAVTSSADDKKELDK